MSNFPNSLDDDVTLPRIDNNITEIGDVAVNATRDAIFSIEEELGTLTTDGYTLKGACSSLATRLGQSIDAYGQIKSSAIASLGLITLPITESQISATAAIPESKLALDHSTASLYNYINNISINQNTALNFITNTGFKLSPHLLGITYRHVLNHIDVGALSDFFKNKKGIYRDNTNLLTLLNDINKDFVGHQKADATVLSADPTSTLTGTIPPDNYAHVATGIHVNTSIFSFIPQTATDLQQVVEFIDSSNTFLLGTRIQTLYDNGIPRTSRATSLLSSDSGFEIVPFTLSTTYLNAVAPLDDFEMGDDIIALTPTSPATDGYVFDAKFSLIKIGDVANVNYGSVIVSFLIKEKFISGSSYILRIAGKNLFNTTTAQVKITRSLFSTDKQGVLALAAAHLPAAITNAYPSLTVGNPRGAEAIGVGFNPDLIDSTHYKLYLQLYPTGNPADSVVSLAAIDVTGNLGVTPGAYTLESIVNSMNIAFRKPGFNYRFIAFSYKGEIGIKLADAIGNASFSIISGVVNSSGAYNQTLTNTVYPNNVIGLFDSKDGLGFGPGGANIASPPYTVSYVNSTVAKVPTRIFVPLTKKTYYVNGAERERLNLEPNQDLDNYGDGYWPAFIITKTIISGSRVEVTYQVNRDLKTSGLKIGKTILVQSTGTGSIVNYGRFVIKDIEYNSCLCDGYTAFATITVYDAIHSTGVTPFLSENVGTNVNLYFSGDSISFNTQNASDSSAFANYKRLFEVFINENGNTFTHERGRMNESGSTATVNGVPLYGDAALTQLNLYRISPKLRGYAFSSIKKINLAITSYNVNSGTISGYLCKWDGATETNQGPVVVGKKGSVVRFYDETNIDFIEVIFDINDTVGAISTTKRMDVQLFSTLSLDDEVMLLGTCQISDSTKALSYLRDERQFGNVSEKELSTSALDFISTPTQLLNENGIIRGFEITSIPTGSSPYSNIVGVTGGVAIVNGKVIQVNNSNIAIPVVSETFIATPATSINTITWFLCVNDKAELEFIASTDYDLSLAGTYGSLDHTRIFYVKNPNVVTPSAYGIRGTYLSDLVLNNKDVTLIATITTTISSPSSTYVVTAASSADARRFVGGGYKGLTEPFTLGSLSSFRSFTSLNTWLNQLTNLKSFSSYNKIGTTVIIKDNLDISGITLNYGTKIKFIGDGGKLTVSSSSATITKNVEFEDIIFDIATANGLVIGGNNVYFDKCIFNYTYDASGDESFVSTNLANPPKACILASTATPTTNSLTNIKITNSKFTSTIAARFAFVSFLLTGQSHYLENIIIENNKVETTAAGDDKRAAFIVACNSTATPSSQLGPRVINCEISGNVFNKNQMILVSGTYNGSSKVTNMPVPVGVHIERNVCGSICFLVRQDRSLNTANTSNINDKDHMLTISKNMCRYIFCGTSDGLINVVDSANRVINDIVVGSDIYSSSVIIDKNTCSWIQVGVKNPTTYAFETPMLEISSNKLNAYLATFLDSYCGSGYVASNIGLIVDSVVGT